MKCTHAFRRDFTLIFRDTIQIYSYGFLVRIASGGLEYYMKIKIRLGNNLQEVKKYNLKNP